MATWTQAEVLAFHRTGKEPERLKCDSQSIVVRPNPPQGETKPKRAGRYGVKKTAGKMTKTEAAFALILEARKEAGEILAWGYEDTSLRIVDASDTQKSANYRPDFRIVHEDHSTEYVEVKRKATMNEASTLRLKMAASKFWPSKFTMAILDKGVWTYKTF